MKCVASILVYSNIPEYLSILECIVISVLIHARPKS